MMRTTPAHLPQMRAHGLAIDDLPDEVLVYDLERHQAHCLNRSAALVWRSLDGKSSPAQVARRLSAEVDAAFTEDIVRLALWNWKASPAGATRDHAGAVCRVVAATNGSSFGRGGRDCGARSHLHRGAQCR